MKSTNKNNIFFQQDKGACANESEIVKLTYKIIPLNSTKPC